MMSSSSGRIWIWSWEALNWTTMSSRRSVPNPTGIVVVSCHPAGACASRAGVARRPDPPHATASISTAIPSRSIGTAFLLRRPAAERDHGCPQVGDALARTGARHDHLVRVERERVAQRVQTAGALALRKLVALGQRRKDRHAGGGELFLYRPVLGRRVVADVEEPHDARETLTAEHAVHHAAEPGALGLAGAGVAVAR